MEQQKTNTTVEAPKTVSRGTLLVEPLPLVVPERTPLDQEVAVKIGEGAVAVGLPNTDTYTTNPV